MNHSQKNSAVFGGGCFWCTEAIYEGLQGVISVMPGYAGGHKENPSYEEVCSGKTGHAEVIRIEYDSALISYKDLLTVFFATHDPTTLNRQGNDVGTQYRSIILYNSEEQKQEAEAFIKEINDSNATTSKEQPAADVAQSALDVEQHALDVAQSASDLRQPLTKVAKTSQDMSRHAPARVGGATIITEVKPLEKFYEAEGYHQKYYQRNSWQPYCQVVIHPKLQKLKEKFQSLLKKEDS